MRRWHNNFIIHKRIVLSNDNDMNPTTMTRRSLLMQGSIHLHTVSSQRLLLVISTSKLSPFNVFELS